MSDRKFEVISYLTTSPEGKTITNVPPQPTFVSGKTAFYAREMASRHFKCAAQSVAVRETQEGVAAVVLVDDPTAGVVAVPVPPPPVPPCDACISRQISGDITRVCNKVVRKRQKRQK